MHSICTHFLSIIMCSIWHMLPITHLIIITNTPNTPLKLSNMSTTLNLLHKERKKRPRGEHWLTSMLFFIEGCTTSVLANTFSHKKWKSNSTCFMHEWRIGWVASWPVLKLSYLMKGTTGKKMCNFQSKAWIHMISKVALARDLYLASVLGRDIKACFLEDQKMELVPN